MLRKVAVRLNLLQCGTIDSAQGPEASRISVQMLLQDGDLREIRSESSGVDTGVSPGEQPHCRESAPYQKYLLGQDF